MLLGLIFVFKVHRQVKSSLLLNLRSKWQEENGLSSRLFDFLQCKQHSSTGPNLSQSLKEKLGRRAKSQRVLRKISSDILVLDQYLLFHFFVTNEKQM